MLFLVSLVWSCGMLLVFFFCDFCRLAGGIADDGKWTVLRNGPGVVRRRVLEASRRK
jgi:hypothetical protein